MNKVILSLLALVIIGLPSAFAEIELDEQYYYELGDTMVINGKLIDYDNFLFKENGIEFEPIKIDIYNVQSPEQVFNIAIFPDCVNGEYPDCDYTFSNSLSLSREVGFTDSIYHVTISYGNDETSYKFGVDNHTIEALKSMSFENVDGQQISISLDKDGYKLGGTINITAYTNFGFKKVLTASIEQIDSPVFSPTRYGSYDMTLDYNQYDNTFTTSISMGDSDKRLGHYKITVFDNLDSAVKYFKVSESGLEIIPSEPTLTFDNQYVRYEGTLHYSGYMDNTFDEEQLRYTVFDDARNNSENKRLIGNNVLLTLDYEGGDYKIIGNLIYVNMNELGYFEGELPITRNIPSDQIITITAETMTQNTFEQFVILRDDIYITYYDEVIYDCHEQRNLLDTYYKNYNKIMEKVALSDGGKYDLEKSKADAYKVDKIDSFKFTSGCE